MPAWSKAFWSDQAGATAIEYGIILAFVSVALASAALLIGDRFAADFNRTAVVLEASADD